MSAWRHRPAPPKQGRASRKAAAAHGAMWTRAGWFVKIAMGVLCLLWIIPTLRLLITSFRPPEDANTSGWWTVFGSRFKATQWTLQNYNDVLFGSATNQTPMGNSFVNSLAVALPATIIPIMIAAFAAYAFTFMEFRGRDTLFIVVVGLWWSPTKSPWCLAPVLRQRRNDRNIPLCLARPRRLRYAACDLHPAQLHGDPAHVGDRVRQDRRRKQLHHVLAAHRPHVGAGAGSVLGSTSSSGSGTTSCSR